MRKSAGIIRVPVEKTRQVRSNGDGGVAWGGVTLVDELVEGVLAVGAGLAPHDGPGVVPHADAIFGDGLPVRFHVALAATDSSVSGAGLHPPVWTGGRDPDLLEVGGEAVHVLVVGQQRLSLRPEEVDVPDAQDGQQDRHVGLHGSSAEVLVLQRPAEMVRRSHIMVS